jgi:hypothetical protein
MMHRITMVSMPHHQTVMASMLHRTASWSRHQLPAWTPRRRGSLCSVAAQMALQVLMRLQS